MQLFAKAAACHADERHGIRLEGHHVDFVDRILDSERDMGDVEQREAIKLCYGAWLGEWSVTYAHGKCYFHL